MGKIVIDRQDATFYFCGSCSVKVSPNLDRCSTCDHSFDTTKSFRVNADFDPVKPLLDQISIFEKSELTNGETQVKTAKKLQIDSEGASFFYCKNCRTSVSRTLLECPNCHSVFTGVINIDSKNHDTEQTIDENPFADDWVEPNVNEFNTSLDVNSKEDTDKSQMYVGFWRRVSAYLLDLVAIYIFGIIVGMIIFVPLVLSDIDVDNFSDSFYNLVGLILSWLYFALWESSEKQATLGKMAIGAKVTDYDGNRISFGKATGRYFSKFISALVLGLGFIAVAFSKKKQGWHDGIAETLVIKKE